MQRSDKRATRVITELVRKLNDLVAEGRPLGTLVSELGPRIYDGRSESLLAEDDDIVVLHISDMHLGPSYPFRLPHGVLSRQETGKKSLAQMLAADLEDLKLVGRIDSLVISGDFTETARLDQFNRAREVLQEILDKIGLDLSRVVVTAGNHDLDWTPGALNQTEPMSGVSRETYETFRELLRFEGGALVDVHSFPSLTGKTLLRVLSLDSNFVEGPKAAGIGYISEDAFYEADRLLKLQDTSKFETFRTWIVLHHHVFPATSLTIEEVQRPKLTVLANSSDLLAFAGQIGAEVILHGHEHQPSVTVARRWPADTGLDFQPIIGVGAGSISAPRSDLGPFSRHQYFILFRKSDHIVIRSRAMGDTGLAFGPHRDLIIPF